MDAGHLLGTADPSGDASSEGAAYIISVQTSGKVGGASHNIARNDLEHSVTTLEVRSQFSKDLPRNYFPKYCLFVTIPDNFVLSLKLLDPLC